MSFKMPGVKDEHVNLGEVFCFLHEWDHGDKTARSRVLMTFVSENTGKSFYELETALAQVASLFLARITTWMRLTYRFGTSLSLQLKSIKIFMSASSHDQYMAEFLEDGGVLTVIDILNQAHIKGEDKEVALDILLIISNTSRKYKELICEANGLNALSECLSISYSEETQRKACAVLHSLSHGNPKHTHHVYLELITLLSHTSPKVQRMVLSTLQSIQSMTPVHHSIVDPLLKMLKTLHLDIQEKAISLILELKHFEVRPPILTGLVSLLQIKELELSQKTNKMEMLKKAGSLPLFVQQAAASKAIRLLADNGEEICNELLSLGVVQHLLFAMGNKEHSDSQIQASLALKSFIRSHPVIQEPLQRIMGDPLFSSFMSNPDTVHININEKQAESLLSNNFTVDWKC